MDSCFNPEMNIRSQIEKIISDVFESLETEYWDEPIIGIAAGDDSYYDFLKEHIGEFHWTPAEAFAQKYSDVPDPSELRVMSIVFPQTETTKNLQKQESLFPCENWVTTRGEWEALMGIFCERLERAFAAKGIRSVCPDLLAAMKPMDSDNLGHSSNWSQRHSAYAAGQGTFGLSDGLITRKGIAVRFTSAVVEKELPVDGRVSEDPYGWCIRCGACVRRCPAGAISIEKGHDKAACSEYKDNYVDKHWAKQIKIEGYNFGCGLCQAGVPCSGQPPKQGPVNYRQIQPSDNPQLAQLVRLGLKGYDLDIPGTAYFDLQLDRLYEYYMANPDKRSYFVAVNDRGRVLGGIGVDMFENLHGYAELQKLYVAEDCRGEGIATHLIEMLEKEAVRLGYKGIYIETHSNLQAAKRLYMRMGYRLIERPEYAVHETMDTFFIKELGDNK